jgi:hypothetical protein
MPLAEDSYAPPHVFVEGEREADITVSMDKIDLQALAEQVYDLLRRELRLERERQGWHQGR